MLISLTNFAMETILYILSTTIMISFPFMQCLSKRKKKIAQRNDSVKKEYNEKNSDYRTTVGKNSNYQSGISATYTVKNQTATEDTRLDTMQDVGNLSRALLDTISILPDETTGMGEMSRVNGKRCTGN
uniref:Uncharacterized protein n=1 Tax=Wuchereria bancrofti TaxID=6293 RepID=A0AAF5PT25_WUCBA